MLIGQHALPLHGCVLGQAWSFISRLDPQMRVHVSLPGLLLVVVLTPSKCVLLQAYA
jgi:hypothetical protein